MNKFVYKKPNIDSKKKLDKSEQELVERSLKFEGRKLVHKDLKHTKNDYNDDTDRGTVEYTPKCSNYSFHKVEIPDNSVLENTNFTQFSPKTKAITGKNLTFKHCNMTNVFIEEDWIIESCNRSEVDSRFMGKQEGDSK